MDKSVEFDVWCWVCPWALLLRDLSHRGLTGGTLGLVFGLVTASYSPALLRLIVFQVVVYQIVGVALQCIPTSKGQLLAGEMVNGVAVGTT